MNRLILIAEKEKVYKEFPLALINRLEKHFIVTSTILNEKQLEIEKELRKFIKNFCFDLKSEKYVFSNLAVLLYICIVYVSQTQIVKLL